jgi:hypothetical protein
MPTISEALRYAEDPATTEAELRRACGILLLPTHGSADEMRARLARHLGSLDSSRPVICLNPGPIADRPAHRPLPRPEPSEYAAGFAAEITLVPPAPDFAALLGEQMDVTCALAITFGEAHAGLRYASDKWSVRETLGHVADCERVLSYRLLRALRGDSTPLPGFDQVAWVPAARFEDRPLRQVMDELAAVREATVLLVRSAAPEDFAHRVPVGKSSITGLALAYLIAGHERQHQNLLRMRYLPCLPGMR